MAKFTLWKTVCAIVTVSATMATAQAQIYTRLATFNSADGEEPEATLVQGLDGDLYGTAAFGGPSGWGTVFKMGPAGLTPLHQFCTNGVSCFDGVYPGAGLVLATDGNLYGSTLGGGDAENCSLPKGCGTIFRISRGGSLTTIHDFEGSDGDSPAAVIQASDGYLYGTTEGGGGNNAGTIFKMSLNGKFITLHSFDGSDGMFPQGRLLQVSDGNFYGTTDEGGVNVAQCGGSGCGTVYRITPEGVFQSLYLFCSQPGCSDGYGPYAGLVQGIDGNLYGTTAFGGQSIVGTGDGTVFRIALGGALTTLYSFCSLAACADGTTPFSALVAATDGNLYGTAALGGKADSGTAFKLSLNGALTTLYSFCQLYQCNDGGKPYGGLVQGTDGSFYGATASGGGEEEGVIYRISVGLGPFVSFIRGAAEVGQEFGVLGQGFSGHVTVSFNGIPASSVVKSSTLIEATVPDGATTGYVTVTTPTGTLTSNVPFHVIR
jgi:uncharacterized repeat protein (TIGR03803 family)